MDRTGKPSALFYAKAPHIDNIIVRIYICMMKYLIFILSAILLLSCGESAVETAARKKVEIVSKIQLYEDSITTAVGKQHELSGMSDHSEAITLDNVERINKKQRDMFAKNQKEIGELDTKIMMYRINISALESTLRKYK